MGVRNTGFDSPWGTDREAMCTILRLAGRYQKFWRSRFASSPPQKTDAVACIAGLRRRGVDPSFVESSIEEFFAFQRDDYGPRAFYSFVIGSWREATSH